VERRRGERENEMGEREREGEREIKTDEMCRER